MLDGFPCYKSISTFYFLTHQGNKLKQSRGNVSLWLQV